MKKKLLALAVAAISLSTAVGGSLAYFNYVDTAHNVITSGGIGIEIVEKTKNGDALVDFPEEGISGVMPGTSVAKIVTVENTGANDAWIRVLVNVAISSGDLPLTPSTPTPSASASPSDSPSQGGFEIIPNNPDGPMTQALDLGGPVLPPASQPVNLPLIVGGVEMVTLDFNTTENDDGYWIDGGDGYYYYSKIVPAGESTKVLFENVCFAKEMGNEYQNCKVYIDVFAEAVQSDNNPIPEGGSVTDIKGWPEYSA